MLKFVIAQMTHSYAQPYDKSDTFIIIKIKNITWGSPNKFQDIIFKISNTFWVSRRRI